MIRIASFNVHNLSTKRSKECLQKIVNIIRKYDIVVLQEVLNEGKMLNFITGQNSTVQARAFGNFFMNYMGPDFDMEWVDCRSLSIAKTNPYISNDRRGEGYAFIWNKRKVELIDEKKRPAAVRNYHVNHDQFRMKREPGYGRFKVRGHAAEIRVITTHIISEKPSETSLNYDVDFKTVELRKKEFEVLAGKIYKKIDNDRVYEHHNAVYTVILGDYNLVVSDNEFKKTALPCICYYDAQGRQTSDKDGCNFKIYNRQEEKTTLGKNRQTNAVAYVNSFDHCSYDEHTRSVVRDYGCYRLEDAISMASNGDEKSYEQMKITYYDDVSDHLPIVVEINC